ERVQPRGEDQIGIIRIVMHGGRDRIQARKRRSNREKNPRDCQRSRNCSSRHFGYLHTVVLITSRSVQTQQTAPTRESEEPHPSKNPCVQALLTVPACDFLGPPVIERGHCNRRTVSSESNGARFMRVRRPA